MGVFYNTLKPFLNLSVISDEEIYLKGTTLAINAYLEYLENKFKSPQFKLEGTATNASGATTIIKESSVFIVPKRKRVTYIQVKNALWCGDGDRAFPNLFRLIGKTIKKNLSNISSERVILNEKLTYMEVDLTSFETYGRQFMSSIRNIGRAGTMTPTMFLKMEENYIKMAVETLKISPIVTAGICPEGFFTGIATVDLMGKA